MDTDTVAKRKTNSMQKDSEWDQVIQAKTKWHHLQLKEVWKYKDLLFLFAKRDFLAAYKQTVLGPLWFIIQPLLTTITFTIIFGNIAKLSTEGIHPIVFYLSGITMWSYFAECLTRTSSTFVSNKSLFGKVYFPRLIMPLSFILTSLLKFGIQFGLLLCFWFYYLFTTNELHPNKFLLFLPLLIIMMSVLGLGFGMIISSMTTKYRDLSFLVGFGLQLLMYASPIIYPISSVPAKFQWLLHINPMTSIISNFKYGLMGIGNPDLGGLLYSGIFGFITILTGTIVFNIIEKRFIDTA